MNTLSVLPPLKAVLPRTAAAGFPVARAGEVAAGLRAPKAKGAGAAPKLLRVLLADDHPIVLEGLCCFLADQEGLQVVGEARDGQEALRLARELAPDVVVMDIDMPRLNGLAVTEILHQELPHIRVLILSMHRNPELVVRVLQSGACGYLLKDGPSHEVLQAIHQVQAGQTFFSSEVARAALNQFVRGAGEGADANLLTHREREVLIQIAKGLSNKETATCLKVGVRTIETHRERIMRKLNIHTVAGLTRFALAKGYVSLSEEPLR